MTLRGTGAPPETRRYDDAQAWADCLRERFGLDLPPGEAAALFERAAASGRQAAGELTAGCARHAVSPGRAARPLQRFRYAIAVSWKNRSRCAA